MKPSTPAAPVEDPNMEWIGPLGVIGVTIALAMTFVGTRAFNLDNDRSAQTVEFFLALGAVAVLYWGYQLELQNRPRYYQRLRDRLLLAIGICSAFGYFNFGRLHFGNFVHVWDTYHYYIGAKYFPEVGYDKMYDCAMIADAESGRAAEASRRVITNLRTNEMVRVSEILAQPERCKASFSPQRWEQYKADVAVFRGWVDERRWSDIHRDHGFNATPVWTLLPVILTNLGPATRDQVFWLNMLDPLYWLLTALIMWWAFGPRAFAVALIMMGCNFANRFYWTGGALLRHDWIFYLVASICLLKKDRPYLAGAAFAYTTLLRLFPGLAALGPAAGAIAYFQLHKKLDPKFVKYVIGGAVATAILMGTSIATLGGVDSWKRLAQNTAKHASTPLTNHMGLRTALSWRPDTVGEVLSDSTQIDPWGNWKATRTQKFNELKPVFYLICAAALFLIYRALKNQKDAGEVWMGLAMGTGFITFGAELTSYYYCFLMGLALLHSQKREVGLILSALCALTVFIEWAPVVGMSRQLDQYYVTMSVATCAACAGVWWLFTKQGDAASLPAEPPVMLFDPPPPARRR